MLCNRNPRYAVQQTLTLGNLPHEELSHESLSCISPTFSFFRPEVSWQTPAHFCPGVSAPVEPQVCISLLSHSSQIFLQEISHACHVFPFCLWECRLLSSVRIFATPQTVARLAPLSMGFSRQEDWSGLLFPPPASRPRDRTRVSCTAREFFTSWATREALSVFRS